MTVHSGGHALYVIGADSLVGEISCLSGAPSTATAVVQEQAWCFRIESARLRRLVAADGELRVNVEAGFARDIRRKILNKNAALRSFVAAAACRPAGVPVSAGARQTRAC